MNIYDRPTPTVDKYKVTLRLGGEDFTYADYYQSRRLEQERDALMEALSALCRRASPDHGWLVPSVHQFEAAHEVLRAIKERK